MLLKKLNLPADVKKLSLDALNELSEEVRQRIIEVTLQNGGHIGASLGAVELIVALLHVFDPDKDKIVFDVGHQAYAYKILTGRNDVFDSLRTFRGISGFPLPSESKYDHFTGGHAGNAVSAGCGYCMARALSKADYQVVSVVGDGVMVNGETAEGLNLVSSCGKQIVVINDNTYSISSGVGSIPEYLARLRGEKYVEKIKQGDESPFAMYELDYIGPVNGHDLPALVNAFTLAKNSQRSVVVHTVTNKGKGYALAENNPLKLHGVSPRGERSGEGFGAVFGEELIKLREKDDKIVAIAAAMAIGTGLSRFIQKYPESFIDVGIAESTALTVAASLARAGYKPYVAMYSTFLQRAYDQLLYDVALDNLNVTVMLDRSGIVGEDGESHQGIYDLSFLSSIPEIKIASPATYDELKTMLAWSRREKGVKVLRYPKSGMALNVPTDDDLPHWKTLVAGKDGYLVAHGAVMIEVAMKVAEILREKEKSFGVLNARFILPVDRAALNALQGAPLYVLEDVVYAGSLSEHLAAMGYKVRAFTLPNGYVTFGKPSVLRKHYGIDADTIAEAIIHEA